MTAYLQKNDLMKLWKNSCRMQKLWRFECTKFIVLFVEFEAFYARFFSRYRYLCFLCAVYGMHSPQSPALVKHFHRTICFATLGFSLSRATSSRAVFFFAEVEEHRRGGTVSFVSVRPFDHNSATEACGWKEASSLKGKNARFYAWNNSARSASRHAYRMISRCEGSQAFGSFLQNAFARQNSKNASHDCSKNFFK